MQASTIDEVIAQLEQITNESIQENDPIGYFSALYLEVTKNIKLAIQQRVFEDNERMEKLDVIFANRYLKAYSEFKGNDQPSSSWKVAFEETRKFWPIVIQHLLLGMNAHIALDLGIAAAQVSPGPEIKDLEKDFNKINEILAGLVKNVENTLSQIWPKLKVVLKLAGRVDDFLINFSMETARNEAWNFAVSLAEVSEQEMKRLIGEKDESVTEGARFISSPGWIISGLFRIIRIGERGSVGSKIQKFIQPSSS